MKYGLQMNTEGYKQKMKELGKEVKCFIFLDCCSVVSLFPLDCSCLAD